MSNKSKMSLERADEISSEINRLLEPLTVKQLTCGSIRRRGNFVGDVDLVVIPQPLSFPGSIGSRLKSSYDRFEVIKQGPKLMQVIVDGIQVDIYHSAAKFWGTHILRWTGSRGHNIKLCTRAQEMGMKLKVSEGLYKGDELIASMTEESIFKALMLPFVPPEKRF